MTAQSDEDEADAIDELVVEAEILSESNESESP